MASWNILGTFSSWTARAFHQESFLFLPLWSPQSIVFYPGKCFAASVLCQYGPGMNPKATKMNQTLVLVWSWSQGSSDHQHVLLQGHFFCVAPVYTAFHMKDYLFVLCLPVNWIVLPPQYPCKGPSSRYTLDFPISYSSSLKYNQLLPFLPKFSTRGWIHFSKLSFHNFLGLSFPIFKTEGVGLDEFCIWHSSLITF